MFLLDANVFMQAARDYYAFDIAPGFWQALVDHANNGQIRSIDRVKAEIDLGNDPLKDWANHSFQQWFESTNADDVVREYQRVMDWVDAQGQWTNAAKAQFASGADGWVVAYGVARGCVVVTNEKFNADVKRKVPIPNVCRVFDVDCLDTFELLRKLAVRLG